MCLNRTIVNCRYRWWCDRWKALSKSGVGRESDAWRHRSKTSSIRLWHLPIPIRMSRVRDVRETLTLGTLYIRCGDSSARLGAGAAAPPRRGRSASGSPPPTLEPSHSAQQHRTSRIKRYILMIIRVWSSNTLRTSSALSVKAARRACCQEDRPNWPFLPPDLSLVRVVQLEVIYGHL